MTVRIYVAVCALYHACVVFAVTRYVSPSGSGTPPYTNWATAAKTIQPAVDLASPGDLILVGNGVYQTGGALTPGGTSSNRVVINKAVTVESANGYQSCLIVGHRINNLSAVRCAYVGGGGVLKGFTLTNGMAPATGGLLNKNGGGAFVATNSTVRDCLITCNESPGGYGAGVYVHMGGTVDQCTIESNVTTYSYGGGACIYEGGTVRSCVIRNNRSYAGAGVACITNGLITGCTIISNAGGGVYVSGGVVTGCFIALNSAQEKSGGIYAEGSSEIVGCTIVSNRDTYGGGGGITVFYNVSDIRNCLIAWNSSTHSTWPSSGNGGGGVQFSYGGGRLRNCTVRDNWANFGGGVSIHYASTAHVENCIIENNHAYGSGGGVSGYIAQPAFYALVSNCILRGNSCSNDGGGANITGNAHLLDCMLISNRAFRMGGGVYLSSGWTTTTSVRRCTLFGNRAALSGGGINLENGLVQHARIHDNYANEAGGVYVYNGILRNCLLMYNSATNNGGVQCASSSGGLVESCTISDNRAFNSNSTGGLRVSDGARVRNTIVYFNTPRDVFLPLGADGATYFAHCCLSTNIAGNNNISANPLFSNRAAYDYRLLEGSPCVDKGTNQPWMFLPTPNNQDIYGQPRIQNLIVDIGAAEGVIPEPVILSGMLLILFSLHRCAVGRNRRCLL